MPYFGNYDPNTFGWSVPNANSDIIPFTYNNVSFPQGIHKQASKAFTYLVQQLLAAGYIPGGLQTPGCWGYEYRPVTGNTSGLSFHAYGLAIDINAPQNGYRADGSPGPHSINDNAQQLTRSLGFEWGGGWTTPKDYMHVELHLSPEEVADLSQPWNTNGNTGSNTPGDWLSQMNYILKYVQTPDGKVYRVNMIDGTAFHLLTPNAVNISVNDAKNAGISILQNGATQKVGNNSDINAYYILGS